MEIKVNEYVRTKDGLIAQIINIIEEDYQERGNILYELDKEVFDETEGYEEYSFYALPNQFVKHSTNIIDLIECGDYVNGHKVIDIAQAPVKAIYTNDGTQKLALIPITNERIRDVVTKEQYDSMKYIVGGE